MLKLSKRLLAVIDLIHPGEVLADIGSDHAHLPIYAMQNGIVRRAIAGEVADGPYHISADRVKEFGLDDKIEVRKGDGLAVIRPDEQIDNIIIAGMGGELILKILEEGKGKLSQKVRLILQPNTSVPLVRKWLDDNYWELKEEKVVEEEDHIYEMMAAEKAHPSTYAKLEKKEILFGPILMREKSAVFCKKWEIEKNKWLYILDQLKKAENNLEIKRRRDELLDHLALYKEVFE